jgi:hypothetical protein
MLGGYVGKLICHALLGIYVSGVDMFQRTYHPAMLMTQPIPFRQMLRSNRARDVKYGPADPQIAADNGMHGMTEKHNTHFR